MKRLSLVLTTLFLSFTICLTASDYTDGWKAIENNQFKEAEKLFNKSLSKGEKIAESYASLVLLQDIILSSDNSSEHFAKYYDKVENAGPYVYSMWFNQIMAGGYGKKSEGQLELLDKILKDEKQIGSLKSAGYYQLSQNAYVRSKPDEMTAFAGQMGGIGNWLVTGTFDNFMGSGFEKDHAPFTSPQKESTFTTKNGSKVTWLDVSDYTNKNWIHLSNHFHRGSSGIIYMQTFVKSSKDQEVTFSLGCAGSVKLWVNDQLAFKNHEERTTELDVYSARCQLNAGYNRVLIQLGTDGEVSPNAMLRIVDEQFNDITGLENTQVVQTYKKSTAKYDESKTIQHFAEAFFESKIKQDPKDLINYLLLSRCYLRRGEIIKARESVEKALAISPENALLRSELLDIYSENDDREETLKEIEWFRKNHTDLPGIIMYDIGEFLEDENYDKVEELISKFEKNYSKNNKELLMAKLGLIGNKQQVDELLTLVDKAYKLYPQDADFLNMKYLVETQINKDFSAGDKLIENYLKSKFNYRIASSLISNYLKKEQPKKAEKWIKLLEKMIPNDVVTCNDLANYAMYSQSYDKALAYNEEALKMSPFSDALWSTRGYIYEYTKKPKEAKKAYEKTLSYNPLNYDVRDKLRELNKEDNPKENFPSFDEYDMISASPADEGDNVDDYKYILIDNSTVIYEDAASEKYVTYIIRVNNQSGVNEWKEASIGYNRYSERFVLEKAEVVKQNGQKLDAESSRNQFVFTDLEEGDAIIIKYKLENYYRGKFAEYFWDDFVFNSFIPIENARYNVLLANNKSFKHEILNKDIEVKEKVEKKGNYTLYTWASENPGKINSEPYMPKSSDVLTTLVLSTVDDWSKISEWYNDMSEKQAKADYDIRKITKEVVAGKTTEFEKAKAIYEYICENIRYSSVSFRQSGLVPQLAHRTLKSKLGDCKDVSTLFATMAREIDIDVNLVLVSTRNNGLNDVAMPSLNFNHCIVKTNLDNEDYYLELTDDYLSFGSLPSNLLNAQILEIPFGGKATENIAVENLKTDNRVKDEIRRKKTVKITGSDLEITDDVIKTGYRAASTRYYYRDITKEKLYDNFKQAVSNEFTNQVIMDDIKFEDLNTLSDDVKYQYSFKVKGEVTKLGSLKSLKIPFADVIVNSKVLFDDDRKQDFSYNFYENTDYYEEEIVISLEGGKKFIELPESKEIAFGKMKYKITFESVNESTLKVKRTFVSERREFSLAEYNKLKPFLAELIELENTHIVFK